MRIANTLVISTLLLAAVRIAPCQTARNSILGTVTEVAAGATEIRVKPDSGDDVPIKLSATTIVQRVAPGEKDLTNAVPIAPADVTRGDRVLVSLEASTQRARRIVVMPAADIARRNEADRQDWAKRGVAGVVAAKNGSQITLRIRSLQGESTATVTTGAETRFRRYAPDSVKFADAIKSRLAEVGIGDQLRARGQKSEDGLRVTAEEVVFGTFLTKAGPITAVNGETKEVTITDLATNRPLIIQVTGDSQLKKLPDFLATMGGPPGSGPPGIAPGGRPGGSLMMRSGPPDLSQMIERMPAASIEDLKPGQSIVVSSTKGANAGRLTAITLIANADFLIRMASARQSGPNSSPGGMSGPGAGMGPGLGMGGLAGGGGGLDLPGMIP